MAYRKRNEQRGKVESIFDLISSETADELADVAENTEVAFLTDYTEEAQEYIDNQGKYMGISTGYAELDGLIQSFLPGELMVIGGDTGHGKSLLAMNIAQNAYKQTGDPVLMVNLELTRPQTVQRFHNIGEGDYKGILIQKASAVRYNDIDVLMKRAKDHGACLVVIDHLHFFSRSAENETRELSRITKHFKECAVQNNLPVILLSHITPTRIMDPEGNTKKVYKPGLHNLKGASSIEQDADIVAFVFRDDKERNKMEFYVRKMRSRELIPESVFLTQNEWKLEGTPSWVKSKIAGDYSDQTATFSPPQAPLDLTQASASTTT